MKRLSLLATLAIGAVLSLSACGGPTEGKTPSTNEPTTSSPSSTTAAPSASASDTPLAGVDPCSLLSGSQLQQLGVPKLTDREKIGTARTCNYQSPLDASPHRGVSIGIRENQGLKDVVDKSGTTVESMIAGRKIKIECYGGVCEIAVNATESSRVDVMGMVTGDTAASKQLAKKATRMVISNLPKTN